MKRSILLSILFVAALLVSCGNGQSNQTPNPLVGSEAAAAAETAAPAATKAAEPEDVKVGNLFEHDFIVKYHIVGWKVSNDYTSASRLEENDASWEVTKEGDTMTVTEQSSLPKVGKQTLVTVFKQVGDDVERTLTKKYANAEYDQILEMSGKRVEKTVYNGTTLDKEVESWFGAKGQEGVFNLGSADPRRSNGDNEVNVTDGDRMFGRKTMICTSTPKKGSAMDFMGYYIETTQIVDAERMGMNYIRYKSYMKLKDGEQRLAFEVTDFKILD